LIIHVEIGEDGFLVVAIPLPRGSQDARRLTAEAEKYLEGATLSTCWNRTDEEALASVWDDGVFPPPTIVKAVFGRLKNTDTASGAGVQLPGIAGVGPSGIYWAMAEQDPVTGIATQRQWNFIKWESMSDLSHDPDGVLTCKHEQFIYDPHGSDTSYIADWVFRAECEQPDDARKLALLAAQLRAESQSDRTERAPYSDESTTNGGGGEPSS
jgi:hypothetical protein